MTRDEVLLQFTDGDDVEGYVGMIDVDGMADRIVELTNRLAAVEADKAAQWDLLQMREAQLKQATDRLAAVEAERDTLRERLAAVEKDRDYYERQVKAGVVSYQPHEGETRDAYRRIYAVEQEVKAERHRADRAERILAALWEPSKAVIADARKQHGYDQYTVGSKAMDAIRAAVEAAEKEVNK